ncbi:hypothetical protein HSX37_10680|uniref:LTXXQ motif family protein n=1 Tax=Dendrosporobacter quercicolus TaxID=146817 RepID=A0A1G9T545_9FIRM|nr:hypothetical protein [Dendrosporobacter quercicolus]NSL48496.1 hypothetical protein [Dendrosporobacter quercicolus DSM 1736]SDM42225.1 hypothetical protein SAMN04488502_104201 [Dendrosporobacter quercicolus]
MARAMKIWSSVFIAIFISLVHSGICLAGINAAGIYQEALWVSMDLPAEQRKQIDDIIVEKAKQVKNLQKVQKIDGMDNFVQLYTLMNYLEEMNNIRTEINSKILQLLPPSQKQVFEMQLEKKQDLIEKTAAMILALDLSDKQQAAIINSLLRNQKKVWSVVAKKSLSWEERRKKLNKTNPLRMIHGTLTRDQIKNLALWLKSV